MPRLQFYPKAEEKPKLQLHNILFLWRINKKEFKSKRGSKLKKILAFNLLMGLRRSIKDCTQCKIKQETLI